MSSGVGVDQVPEIDKRNAVARARVQHALDLLQEAQNLVGRALQSLSPITGGALPVYNKGHKLYDQVHRYWYVVNALKDDKRARKLGLDHDPRDGSTLE